MRENPRSGCPINLAVEAFGDRWSLLVLRDVMFGDRRYFRELLAGSEERIASNILADRLKRLVGAGLLTRAEARPGQRAKYSLTETAIDLVPVLAELGAWGVRHRYRSRGLNCSPSRGARGQAPYARSRSLGVVRRHGGGRRHSSMIRSRTAAGWARNG